MPSSSLQDILYVVLSICVLWTTVFLCWVLFEAGKALRNINKIMNSLVKKLEYISEAVTFMRDKVDNVSKHMGSMSGILSGLLEKFVLSKLTSKMSSNLEDRLEKKKSSSKRK